MLKKILYWLIGIAVLLLLAMLLIGWMNPRYEDSVEVTVDAPIEKTWALFDNLENMGEWVPGYVGHEMIEGDGKSPGSKYRLDFDMDGRKFSMVETVTYYSPLKGFAFDVDDESGATFNIRVDLMEDGDQTVIRETMTGAPNGIFDRAMTAIMKGQIRDHKLKMYNDLKDFIEASDWSPPPPKTALPDSVRMDSIPANSMN